MIINCKDKAELLKYQLRDCVSKLKSPPKIAIVRFGYDKASEIYANGIIKDCNFTGIKVGEFINSKDMTEQDAIAHLKEIESEFHGIIIHKPVPNHISIDSLLKVIPIEKDIDGIKKYSVFSPCTPLAIMEVLNNFELKSKNCLVVSRSNTVGIPLIKMLLEKDANVTVCHSKTHKTELGIHCQSSDIVILAAGAALPINANELKPHVIVISVGIHSNYNSPKLFGDIENLHMYEYVNQTPLKSGVGLLTRAKLLENTLRAYKIQEDLI